MDAVQARTLKTQNHMTDINPADLIGDVLISSLASVSRRGGWIVLFFSIAIDGRMSQCSYPGGNHARLSINHFKSARLPLCSLVFGWPPRTVWRANLFCPNGHFSSFRIKTRNIEFKRLP